MSIDILKLIIGLILILSPFLLVLNYKNKLRSFIVILFFALTGNLLIAVVTQFFHVFTYPVLLTVHFLITILIFVRIKYQITQLHFEKGMIKNIDWTLGLITVLLFLHLYKVHYNYSGISSVISPPYKEEVRNMVYPYPYFADEWYAVSLIKYSIDSGSLPFTNTLKGGAPFVNMQFAFHSILSEFILLLGLDPLLDYAALTLFFGMLICILVYLLLRSNQIGKLPASIASLSVLYITNGANLPGIWYLFPIIFGIIFMLMSFFFFDKKSMKLKLLMISMALLFYPPLFPFIIMGVLFSKDKIIWENTLKDLLYFIIITAVVALILSVGFYVSKGTFQELFSYIFSKLYYQSFTPNAIPRYLIWDVIPIPVIIIAIIGLPTVFKQNKWLISMIVIGLFYWILYSFVMFRVIIGYQRVVLVTSILITIVSGFGANALFDYFLHTQKLLKGRIPIHLLQVGVLLLFFFLSFHYTERDNWSRLLLIDTKGNKSYFPAPPANKYLHLDDLVIFKDIKNSKFYTIPWKGTVIGVATDNFPVIVKSGTIGFGRKKYKNFMNLPCDERYNFAIMNDLEYIYGPKFDCDNFNPIMKSRENYILYKIE